MTIARAARTLVGSLFLVIQLVACGGDGPPPPDCNGTSCTCPAQEACDIGDSGCSGASCSLNCTDHNDCGGTCGASCSVSCKDGSECDVTVGASGSMSCDGGSTCTLRCTAGCSLSCAGDSTCKLQCASDADPHVVVEGGSCP
jgi:hypothetical protein